MTESSPISETERLAGALAKAEEHLAAAERALHAVRSEAERLAKEKDEASKEKDEATEAADLDRAAAAETRLTAADEAWQQATTNVAEHNQKVAKAKRAKADTEQALQQARELASSTGQEAQKRDSRRSAVRVYVTYLAAAFLFGAGTGVVGYLLATDKISDAKDLFMAILPVAAAVVTYWFATRKDGTVDPDAVVKIIDAYKKDQP